MEEKLIPFDLITALAHPDRVRTRDDRKVRGIHDLTDEVASGRPIVGVVQGNSYPYSWRRDGKVFEGMTETDLMLTEPQPDANGWYKISEVPLPALRPVVVGAYINRRGCWLEYTIDQFSEKLAGATHWRYPKPPVKFEGGK